MNVRMQAEKSMIVVSAFFPAGKPKHSAGKYRQWISNFFSTVNANTFIFTTPEQVDLLIALLDNSQSKYKQRTAIVQEDTDEAIADAVFKSKAVITFITAYTTAANLPTSRILGNLTKQHELDTEIERHHPDLYLIWTGKPWMLNRIASLDIFPPNSYYFWIDIGAQRHAHLNYGDWPDQQTLNLHLSNRHEVLLSVVSKGFSKFYKEKGDDVFTYSKHPQDFIIAGYFGGTAAGCAQLSTHFYALQKDWSTQGRFIGKEQSILDALALNRTSEFYGIWLADTFDDFQNQYYTAFWSMFAGDEERRIVLKGRPSPKLLPLTELI